MSRVAGAAAALALALTLAGGGARAAVPIASAAGRALPPHGVLSPGVSLAGIRLGMPAARVVERLGRNFGRCSGCARETWYYNLRPFSPQGLGVELQRGRVSAVFTLWSPPGWRTSGGLALGAPQESIRTAFPGLGSRTCDGYEVLVAAEPSSATAFLVVGGKLWGFSLAAPGGPLCR